MQDPKCSEVLSWNNVVVSWMGTHSDENIDNTQPVEHLSEQVGNLAAGNV